MKYNTDRKKEIIALFSAAGERALTTEEICDKIPSLGKGKSTVYRIISELVRDGDIKKIADPKTRRVTYQYLEKKSCGEHLHLKCTGCGEFVHLTEKLSKLLCDSLLLDAHFAIDETKTLLFGRCARCAGGTR